MWSRLWSSVLGRRSSAAINVSLSAPNCTYGESPAINRHLAEITFGGHLNTQDGRKYGTKRACCTWELSAAALSASSHADHASHRSKHMQLSCRFSSQAEWGCVLLPGVGFAPGFAVPAGLFQPAAAFSGAVGSSILHAHSVAFMLRTLVQ